jgi:hypothetical protein
VIFYVTQPYHAIGVFYVSIGGIFAMVNNNVRVDGMKRIAINSNSMNVKKMNIDVTMVCVFQKNTGSMVSIAV